MGERIDRLVHQRIPKLEHAHHRTAINERHDDT